jgi:ketopantoate reductase
MDVIREVAVVGPGAVGTTVAGYLYAAGHQILLCGRTPRLSNSVDLAITPEQLFEVLADAE